MMQVKRQLPAAAICVELLLLLLSPIALNAQKLEITLGINASRICLQDTLLAEYRITGNLKASSVPLPDIKGFKTVGKPGQTQQRNLSIINGKQTETNTAIFFLRLVPVSIGDFEIPALEMANGKTSRYRSNTRTVSVVSDCASRMPDTSFHAIQDDLSIWESMGLNGSADMQDTDDSLLAVSTPYILVISGQGRHNTPALRSALELLDDSLSNAGYQRIGIFRTSDQPTLYYGIFDSILVKAKLDNWMKGFPALKTTVYDEKRWQLQTVLIMLSPEYQLMLEIAGQARGLAATGEDLKTPRNIYITFDFKSAADRLQAMKWANEHSIRTAQPADLNPPDKAGNYGMWLSIHEQAFPKQLFPKVERIINHFQQAFPKAQYAGILMQPLKQ